MWTERTHRPFLSKQSFKRIKGSQDGVPPQSEKPSTTTPTIRIMLNGLWIDALLDTGSTITIINEEVLFTIIHEERPMKYK